LLAGPLALVFGNERYGIAPDVIEACDAVVQIPVFGVKNSLNVANAAAVAAFEVLRQWRSADAA
jgi:tRNA G18 (ribose-2'-O)-methylase SpoU